MTVAVVGWVLIILGFLFLVLGLVGAARKVLVNVAGGATTMSAGFPWIEVIKALLKEGTWGVCAALGVGLLVLGLFLTGSKLPGLTT